MSDLVLVKSVIGEIIVGKLNENGDVIKPMLLSPAIDDATNGGKIALYPYFMPLKTDDAIIFKDKIISISKEVPDELIQLYERIVFNVHLANPQSKIIF